MQRALGSKLLVLFLGPSKGGFVVGVPKVKKTNKIPL
jgi:hypothetical protein